MKPGNYAYAVRSDGERHIVVARSFLDAIAIFCLHVYDESPKDWPDGVPDEGEACIESVELLDDRPIIAAPTLDTLTAPKPKTEADAAADGCEETGRTV